MAKNLDKARVKTKKGLFNDVVVNLHKIALEGWNETASTDLQFFDRIRFDKRINPEEIDIDNLPALCTWCDGFEPNSDVIGQASGRNVNTKLKFYTNVRCMIEQVSDEEAQEHLYEVAWYMWEHIRSNKDLHGLADTETVVPEVTLKPRAQVVNDKLQPVSNVNFQLIFTINRKSSHAQKYQSR